MGHTTEDCMKQNHRQLQSYHPEWRMGEHRVMYRYQIWFHNVMALVKIPHCTNNLQ